MMAIVTVAMTTIIMAIKVEIKVITMLIIKVVTMMMMIKVKTMTIKVTLKIHITHLINTNRIIFFQDFHDIIKFAKFIKVVVIN